MRALRIATLLLVVISLLGGTTVAVMAALEDGDDSIRSVAGTVAVQQLPGGTFDIDDRIFQYRAYQVAGSMHQVSDPRLAGYLLSEWNWDVQSSGDRPVPTWGNIVIAGDDGAWRGDFTGIRDSDFEPIGLRAVLFGEGPGQPSVLRFDRPDRRDAPIDQGESGVQSLHPSHRDVRMQKLLEDLR